MWFLRLLLFLLLLVALTACPGGTSTKPTISSFNASPSSITAGQSSILAWTVTGSSPITLSIDQGVGTVTGEETTVSPASSTTYTLTAKNNAGSDTQQVTVTVNSAPSLEVNISSPSSDTHTNGSVTFQVAVSGGTPDTVELMRDGEVLVNLSPPYTYTWDTTSEPEGAYEITARATLDGQSFVSSPRTVTIDRTSPAVTSRTPAPGSSNVWVQEPIEVTFSEPLKESTITDSSVLLTASGGVNLAKMLSLSEDATTVHVELVTSPDVPTTLTASLTSGITDLAGNALSVPSGAWSWSLPAWMQLGDAVDVTFVYASISVDGDGQPLVTWYKYDGTSRNVYVKRYNQLP